MPSEVETSQPGRQRRVGWLSRTQQLLLGLLGVIAAGLVAGMMVLTTNMLDQTEVLNDQQELTQAIVDGNVRTMAQVQREVLRLDLLLQETPLDRPAIRLQGALVAQRVQEASLPHQLQTLQSQELLDRAQALHRQWEEELDPLLRTVLRGSRSDARAAADSLAAELLDVELAYNRLVSDGENNRKAVAGEANRESQAMVDKAQDLVVGLLLTIAAIALLVVVLGVTFSTFHRQRERAAQTLRDLNTELRKHAHVVAATDNMVVITDADGLVDWVNPAFERRTGYRLEDVRGRTPGSVLQHEDVDPETTERMRTAVREGRSFSAEVLNHAADGSAYWIFLEVNPLHDQDGELTGFVAVQSDITERRHSEALLRQAMEAAEETARAKSNFLASMSHEIRTPLNAVLGLTDLLLLTDLDADQRDYVRTAHTSGRLLLALVNDILDFSALESGHIELERRPVAVHELLRDTVGMFESEARRTGVVLALHLAPGLPEHVLGDETRMRQVMVNLLGNAMKFTERGSVRVTAAVGTGPLAGHDGPVLELSVVDTGPGIHADNLDRLFQPFTQEDASTSRKHGGTGLGLAICRLIAEQLHGTIEVESRVGEGSTFRVRLPLTAATPEPQRLRPSSPVHSDVSDLRVLLAEDDEVNQKVARHMLGRLGITPDVVGDGSEAVRAVLDGDYDVVLMDVHMPGTDGVEATHRLHELLAPHERPWIIAVTANALDGDRERLLSHGMDAYLSKPVQLDALHHQLVLARVAAGAPPQPEGAPAPPRLRATADRPSPVPRSVTAAAAPPSPRRVTLEPADPADFRVRTGVEDDDLYAALLRELAASAARIDAAHVDPVSMRADAVMLLSAASTSSAPALVEASRSLRDACVAPLPDDTVLAAAVADVRAEGARLREWVVRRPAPV